MFREIAYDGYNYKWGFQIEEAEQRNRWFKLDLDPSQVLESPLASTYVDRIRDQQGQDPAKLVTDFLAAIRRHAEQVLRYNIPEGALLSTPIEYIVCYQSAPKKIGSTSLIQLDYRPCSVV